jgi:hypothetical protein
MKKLIIRTATALIMVMFLSLSPSLFAQGDPAPPPPPDQHGLSGNQPVGGGAPVGSGLTILLALGAAYGGKRLYQLKQQGS